MKAKIKFSHNAQKHYGEAVNFDTIREIHYNYDKSNKIAIECEDTGYTYNISDIDEIVCLAKGHEG